MEEPKSVKGNGEPVEAPSRPKRDSLGREFREKTLPDQPINFQMYREHAIIQVKIKGDGILITKSKASVRIGQAEPTQVGMRPARGRKNAQAPLKSAEQMFKESFYVIPGQKMPDQPIKEGGSWPYFKGTFGLPAKAFKEAVISVALMGSATSPIIFNRLIRAYGCEADRNLAELVYDKVEMRYITLPNPTDRTGSLPVWRPEFHGWSCEVLFRVSTQLMNVQTFIDLLRAAGDEIGVGDCRFDKSGCDYGLFLVDQVRYKIEKPTPVTLAPL